MINRQQDFLRLNNCKNKHIFLLSDFQKNVSRIQKSIIDTSILVRLIPIVSSEINNVYIDSVWFENPVQQFNTTQILHAIVVNKSNKEIVSGSLKLIVNGKQMSINSFDIDAENKKDVSISFKVKDNGINNGVLKIEDYPIAYDDDFYFSFNAKSTINVLVIDGKENKTAASFKSLMQNDSLFLFHESLETEIDYSLFSKLNMIVLNDLANISSGLTMELQKFISQGGSLVVFPKPQSDLKNYNLAFQNLRLPQIESKDSLDTKTQLINFEQGLFEGVFEKVEARMDLPKIREHYVFKGSSSTLAEPIIMLQNGQSLLSQYSFGKGKVYLFSIASNDQYSNFIKHALFVPTIIKIGVLSLKPISLYYQTSANQSIEMNSKIAYKDKPLHISKINSTIDLIPEQKVINNKTMLFTQNQIAEAGHYLVSQVTNTISGIAFNFNRKESDMNFYSTDDLKANIEGLNLKNVSILSLNESSLMSEIKEINSGDKLWKLFIILALVFLLIEVLVIRLFK